MEKSKLFKYNKVSYGKFFSSEEVFTLEEFVAGEFCKYVNNDGHIIKNSDTSDNFNMAECLAHFSYQKSKGNLLLVDIQVLGTIYMTQK